MIMLNFKGNNTMKKTLLLLTALLFAAGCTSTEETFENVEIVNPPSVSEELAEGQLAEAENTELPFEYRINALMPQDGNYVFSPLSLKMSLDLAANGSSGKTHEELLSATGIEDIEEFNDYERQLVTTYVNNGDIQIKVANSLWLNSDKLKELNFSDEYTKIIGKLNNAKLGSVSGKEARNVINTWCGQNTVGRISDIIPDDKEYRSYLVNALYFSGVWTKPFTGREESFFIDRSGTSSRLEFMSATNEYNFYEDSEVKIIELPFGLPKEKKDADENAPDSVDIAMYVIVNGDRRMDPTPYLDILSREKVHVMLPPIDIEFGADFAEDMKTLGIESAFGKNGEFDIMFGNASAKFGLENIIHKSALKINENGAEQLSAEVLNTEEADLSEEDEIKEFTADKPFTFLILDKRMNEVLYLGEYAYTN